MRRAWIGLSAALLGTLAVPALAETLTRPGEQPATLVAPATPVTPPTSVTPTLPANPPPTLAELQAWESGWTWDERRQVQRALQLLGLYNSGIDGIFGRWTRAGIVAFQQARPPAEPTGYLTREERAALAVAAALEAERQADAAAGLARTAAASPAAEEIAFETGNVYRGDRNRDGYGVYEWTAGHRYEGGWDNTRQGFGVLTLANGWRYAGQWSEAIFVGYGVAQGPDGTRQVGEWNVPQGTQFSAGLNGWGQVTAADGTVARGQFVASVLAAAE